MKKNAYVYAKGQYLYVVIYLNNGKKVDMPFKQIKFNSKLQFLICKNVDNILSIEEKTDEKSKD